MTEAVRGDGSTAETDGVVTTKCVVSYPGKESGFVNEIHWCGTCDSCRNLMVRAMAVQDRERAAAADFVESIPLATDSLFSSGAAPAKTFRWNMDRPMHDGPKMDGYCGSGSEVCRSLAFSGTACNSHFQRMLSTTNPVVVRTLAPGDYRPCRCRR